MQAVQLTDKKVVVEISQGACTGKLADSVLATLNFWQPIEEEGDTTYLTWAIRPSRFTMCPSEP